MILSFASTLFRNKIKLQKRGFPYNYKNGEERTGMVRKLSLDAFSLFLFHLGS
jgi:hypothetical protein